MARFTEDLPLEWDYSYGSILRNDKPMITKKVCLMHKISHYAARMWFLMSTVVFISMALSIPGYAQPIHLGAIANDVSQTAGAVQLGKMYTDLKEDGFEMRFRILEVANANRWNGVDLKAQSHPLKVEQSAGGVEIQLPNGGTCTVSLSSASGEAVYNVRFSSEEVGAPATIPVKRGNIILLGAPQNNAHDATFVQIVLSGMHEKRE